MPLETGKIIDLTNRMNAAGELRWDAPPGEWMVVRLGHATNLKMTRPVPSRELGLECDSLCVNSLAYDGRSDFPIGEFWTERAFRMLSTVVSFRTAAVLMAGIYLKGSAAATTGG